MPSQRKLVKTRKGGERHATNFSFEAEVNLTAGRLGAGGSRNLTVATQSLLNRNRVYSNAFAVGRKIKGPKEIGRITAPNGKTAYWYVDRRKKTGTVFNRRSRLQRARDRLKRKPAKRN